ncbi:hypothetical protein N9224_00470 [Akkermansiaceae bacterium]|nr:hypothetical protein [Akkermansiaceae bacterium]MDB4500638.1 hypothetical protein [Akkermansiaceae bacterium]
MDFYDKGFFKATDPVPAPETDALLISTHFETLQPTKEGGTARWYFWCDQKGEVEVKLNGKGSWNIKLGTLETVDYRSHLLKHY